VCGGSATLSHNKTDTHVFISGVNAEHDNYLKEYPERLHVNRHH